MSSSNVYVSKSGLDIMKKLIDIYFPQTIKTNVNDDINISRKIGSTDYEKFEKLSKEIEQEEILDKKTILKMLNPNDLLIQKQMFTGSNKPKLEIGYIYKNEGDFFLNNKNYKMAQNSYEKSLSFLFFNEQDDEEIKEKVKKLKLGLNLNLSLLLIKQSNFKEALGFLIEAQRLEKNNLKIKYRMALCHKEMDNLIKSEEIITNVLNDNNSNSEVKEMFLKLKDDIETIKKNKRKKEANLYKKMLG